jgi:hypothetical protein
MEWDWYDALIILGLLLLTIGVYFVYAPLALIVPGALLLVYGVVGGVNNAD